MSKSARRQKIIRHVIDAIKAERLRLNLSQNQVAKRAKLDHTMILRVEKGDRMPTIDTLLRMADAVGLELGALVTDANQTFPPKPKQG